MQVPTHGPIGIGIPERQTGTSSWNGTPTLRIEDYDEAPPLFPEPLLAWFFPEEWTRGKREEHDTCSDKKQMPTGPVGASLKDTVSPMTRSDTTMTVLANSTTDSWEVPSMRKTNIFQVMKKVSRTMMSILMRWPRHKKKKQKLWHPWPQQTEHCVKLETSNTRYEWHVVISPRQQLQRDRNNKKPERKCVICNGPHRASQSPEKQGKPGEKKGETTAHTTYVEFSMAIHAETSMFAQEALETGKALI